MNRKMLKNLVCFLRETNIEDKDKIIEFINEILNVEIILVDRRKMEDVFHELNTGIQKEEIVEVVKVEKTFCVESHLLLSPQDYEYYCRSDEFVIELNNILVKKLVNYFRYDVGVDGGNIEDWQEELMEE